MTATHIVPGASFSPEQIEQRKNTLGASEVPAVLGLDRYKGAHDVWLVKKGIAPAFEGNEHTEWGLRVEPVIRQKVAETLGVEIDLPGTLIGAEPWMSATPDGQFVLDGDDTILEIKNKSDRQAVHWGVSGTDQVPVDISAQVYWQMMVSGISRAAIAVLFGKSDFRLYHLTRDEQAAATVLDRCRSFWFDHVVANVPPEIDGSEQITAYLRQKFSAHGNTMRDATREEDGWIAQLRDVRAEIKDLEGKENSLKNRLMAAIGEDAGIVGRSGRVTWKAPDGVTVSWKAVAEALCAPQDLIAKHSTPQARKFVPFFPKG